MFVFDSFFIFFLLSTFSVSIFKFVYFCLSLSFLSLSLSLSSGLSSSVFFGGSFPFSAAIDLFHPEALSQGTRPSWPTMRHRVCVPLCQGNKTLLISRNLAQQRERTDRYLCDEIYQWTDTPTDMLLRRN